MFKDVYIRSLSQITKDDDRLLRSFMDAEEVDLVYQYSQTPTYSSEAITIGKCSNFHIIDDSTKGRVLVCDVVLNIAIKESMEFDNEIDNYTHKVKDRNGSYKLVRCIIYNKEFKKKVRKKIKEKTKVINMTEDIIN